MTKQDGLRESGIMRDFTGEIPCITVQEQVNRMKKLHMRLFGHFELEKDGRLLNEETLRSKKLTNLLIYLLINRDQLIAQQSLIDAVLGYNIKNPEGALRNLIYRLRNELKVLGDEEFIITFSGAYRWNPSLKVETDYECYEKEVERLMKLLNGEPTGKPTDGQELCEKIIELYHGNVTSRLSDEIWLVPRATAYQNSCMKAIHLLSDIYQKQEAWPALERLCLRALDIDPCDVDVYCWLIRSMYQQGHADPAMRTYEKAKRLFFERRSKDEIRKLQEAFRELLAGTERAETDIRDLLQDMQEQEPLQGIFFCDYQIFREVYRMEARRAERLGIEEYLILLTMHRTSPLWQNAFTDSGQMKEMETLEQIVFESLRKGDVATRFSSSQLLILLAGCNYENSLAVIDRIKRQFCRKVGKRQLELTCELQMLSPANLPEEHSAEPGQKSSAEQKE